MIRARYSRRKAPRYYDSNGRRHFPTHKIFQDGRDFYIVPKKNPESGHAVWAFTSTIRVTDFDMMAAGKARAEFKKYAKKMGWKVTFMGAA